MVESFIVAGGVCGCAFCWGFIIFCVFISASINLLPNEQMLMKNNKGKWVVNGPGYHQLSPFNARERRTATLLDDLAYAVIQEQLTGALRNVEGPKLLFLGAYDEILATGAKMVLAKGEYVKLVDDLTGNERVVEGPMQVVPSVTERIPEGKVRAVMVDTETAVLIQNKVTGVQRVITEPGAFIPTADEIVVEERMLMRVLPHEAVAVRDARGSTTVYKGDINAAADSDGISFFVPPFGQVVKMYWTAFDTWGVPLTEPGSGEGPIATSLMIAASQTAESICTNCGPEPSQCLACDGPDCACTQRGYCNACDSPGGIRGACCKQGDADDPDECQDVSTSTFRGRGAYHECVIVPVIREGGCQPWCTRHTASWTAKCGWDSLACAMCPECSPTAGATTTRITGSSYSSTAGCSSSFEEQIGTNIRRVQVIGESENALDAQCCSQCSQESLCTFWVRQSSRRRRETKTCWLRSGAIGDPISHSSRRGGTKLGSGFSGSGAMVVSLGSCTLDGPSCAVSPNYPSPYPDSSSCAMIASGDITVESFQTEASYDRLFVNSVAYSGSGASGLQVSPTEPIVWSADGNTGAKGWKICANGASGGGGATEVVPEGKMPVTHIDQRARKQRFSIPVRTSDNVPLELGGTIFWQIVEVDRMINTTSDPVGDMWYHARSSLIYAVSRASLGTFMTSFNQIIADAFVLDSQDGFYDDRGIEVQQIELTSYSAADSDTVTTLREIIKETVQRLVSLELAEGQNEARQEAIVSEVVVEGKRTDLITQQRNNSRTAAQTQGVLDGRKPATKITSFIDGLSSLPGGTQSNLALYEEHKAQEYSSINLRNLATGNASFYLASDSLSLQLRINAAGTVGAAEAASRRAAAANGTTNTSAQNASLDEAMPTTADASSTGEVAVENALPDAMPDDADLSKTVERRLTSRAHTEL